MKHNSWFYGSWLIGYSKSLEPGLASAVEAGFTFVEVERLKILFRTQNKQQNGSYLVILILYMLDAKQKKSISAAGGSLTRQADYWVQFK